MGASAPVKYHHLQRFSTYSVKDGTLLGDSSFDLFGTSAEDIVRWGVWLGRHSS